MAKEKELSLSDLLKAGDLKTKLLGILPAVLSEDKKRALLEQIGEGKPVKEVHTKAGRKKDAPQEFDKRECLTGHMTLPSNGEWTCFAVWNSGNKLFQGTFRMKLDPDPSKTVLSLQMASPPGAPGTSFTVVDSYFKIDTDGKIPEISIAGELGVSYRDKNDKVRTIMFTTQANKVIGL